MDWQTTIQDWGGTLIDRWSAAEWVQPYEVQRLHLQALGTAGMYQEGQPNMTRTGAQNQGLTITPNMLLLAGAVAIVLLIMRD